MPTDEQIEAAANVCAIKLFGRGLCDVRPDVQASLLSLARAALEAAERAAWQPIETLKASDDVRINVLLWHEPSRSSYIGHRTSNGFWSNSHKGGSRFMPHDGEPTLYRIVEPPRLATKEQRP